MRGGMRRSVAGAAGGLLARFLGLGGSVTTMIVGAARRQTYEVDGDLKVTEPDFRRSAEALGNPMVGGNSATLLENGDEIFPAMVRDIRSAKLSVNLET